MIEYHGTIEFGTSDVGQITFSYREDEKVPCCGRTATRMFRHSGVIPPAVRVQGENEIHAYAWKEIKKVIGKEKVEREKWDKARKSAVADIEFINEGVTIRGKIVWSEKEEWHVVRLESPGQGETLFSFGTGCGSTASPWDGLGKFSTKSIIWAENVLIRLYGAWKNRDNTELARRLNRR